MKRRDFLKYGAGAGAAMAASPFVAHFYQALLDGVISKAYAVEAGSNARRYVSFNFIGAPSRFTFDHWLKTNANDPFMYQKDNDANRTQQVATTLQTSGGMTNAVYRVEATPSSRGVLVPILWQNTVQLSSRTARLDELLPNMAVIRGYGHTADGHTGNNTLQQAPIAGKPSIAGAVADASRRRLEAVQCPNASGWSAYASDRKISPNVLANYMDPVSELTAPMRPEGPATGRHLTQELKDNHKTAMELARDRLKMHINSDRTGTEALRRARDNAEELMKTAGENAIDAWNESVVRYETIVMQAFRDQNAIGFTQNVNLTVDARTNVDDSSPWSIQSGGIASLQEGQNLLQIVRTGVPFIVAEMFALVEFLLLNNLASSIEVQPGVGTNTININGLTMRDGTTPTNINIPHDMHASGAITTALHTGAYWRGVGACILELRDRLMASNDENGNNQWENTVLQLMSDFGRAPRSSGTGSDHGFYMMATSLFTGAFTNGPHVMGNVRASGKDAGYEGTVGYHAPVPGYTNDPAAPSFMGSQVMHIVGLTGEANPYKNFVAAGINIHAGVATLDDAIKGKVVA